MLSFSIIFAAALALCTLELITASSVFKIIYPSAGSTPDEVYTVRINKTAQTTTVLASALADATLSDVWTFEPLFYADDLGEVGYISTFFTEQYMRSERYAPGRSVEHSGVLLGSREDAQMYYIFETEKGNKFIEYNEHYFSSDDLLISAPPKGGPVTLERIDKNEGNYTQTFEMPGIKVSDDEGDEPLGPGEDMWRTGNGVWNAKSVMRVQQT